ncbi:hypothetical protein BN439_2409 [Erwinia amylovora Ea644]|nr:hypothetical protein BN439_2409 [Erwinia amylovora Ea644]CCP07484.1 hypothetical protein BN440_2463 [Erwinia amylovora MR1]
MTCCSTPCQLSGISAYPVDAIAHSKAGAQISNALWRDCLPDNNARPAQMPAATARRDQTGYLIPLTLYRRQIILPTISRQAVLD